MALNQTDKDCLDSLHDYLIKRKQRGQITDDEKVHLEAIKTGEEVDRVAAAKWYAENVELPRIQGALATIDSEKADLQARETALQAYIA